MKKILAVLSLTGLTIFISCGSNDCPEGMHEQELQDGSTVCVPDN